MWAQTAGAVLDAVSRIGKAAATVLSEGVKRAVAEKTAEAFGVCTAVAGEVLTIGVLEKIVICHSFSFANML